MKRAGLMTLLAVALFAGVAFAAAESAKAWGVFQPKLPSWLGGGVYIGSTATADTANKLSTFKRCTLNWDFGSLGGTQSANNVICEESGIAATCTGIVFGDQVGKPGVDQALPNAFGNVDCYVSAADSVKCRACADGISDGGSFNIPDASYTIPWMH